MPRHGRCFQVPAAPALAVLVLLALAALSPAARAEDDSRRTPGFLGLFISDAPRPPKPWHRHGDFYAGLGVGPTFTSDHRQANDDGSLRNVDATTTGFGWHLQAGFAGRYWGAELGWLDSGSAKFEAVSDGSGDSWGAGDVSAKVEGGGWTASGLLRVPIKPRWLLLARVGVLGWSTKETFTETFGSETYTSYDEDSGTSAMVGVGFEYDIYSQDRFWIRTEMTRTQVDNDELPVVGVNGSLVFHY